MLSACGPGEGRSPAGPPPPEPENGDWVIAPLDADPVTLDWAQARDRPSLQIGHLISEALVDHGPDLAYVPRLASGWETSADGRTLTFHLRRGVAWHDGRPFDAGDVLATYQRAMDPEVGGARYRAYFAEVEAVDAPDRSTIRVRYRRPFAPALQGWTALLIQPDGGGPSPGGTPVGTGPFVLRSRSAGREWILERNPNHWSGGPHLDRVVFRILPDPHASFRALLAGEMDLAVVPPGEAIPVDHPRLRVERFGTLNVRFIAWNADGSNPFFGDPRVRRAMTQALDRQGFLDAVLQGRGRLATSTVVPGTWAHDGSIVPWPYDPEAAARLLDEAGWSDRDGDGLRDREGIPFRFSLVVFQEFTAARQIALLLQDSLSRLGVALEIEALDWAAFLERLHGRRFQAQLSAWSLDPDPDPYDFWHSSQIAEGSNYAGYRDPEVDRWCEEGRAAFDLQQRRELYHRVQRRLHRDQPFTFLFHPLWVLGIDARLQGMRFPPNGPWGGYPSVLDWWVPRSQQRYPAAAGDRR